MLRFHERLFLCAGQSRRGARNEGLTTGGSARERKAPDVPAARSLGCSRLSSRLNDRMQGRKQANSPGCPSRDTILSRIWAVCGAPRSGLASRLSRLGATVQESTVVESRPRGKASRPVAGAGGGRCTTMQSAARVVSKGLQ